MPFKYPFIIIVLFFSLTLPLMAAEKTSIANEDERSVLERSVLKVEQKGRYKAVYDIHTEVETAGINRGLYYARGLIEAFEKQGVKPDQLDIHLVLHGNAAKFLLVDETYQDVTLDPFNVNLNSKITQDLIDLGVSVEICHSTMRSKGWKAEDVLPGVVIVHDGYTRLIKLQNDGYAMIGGF